MTIRRGTWIPSLWLILFLVGAAHGADYWGGEGGWKAENDPRALGKKVVDELIGREFPANYQTRGGMSYPEVCTAYGALRFAGETGDKDRLGLLVKRYEIFFTPKGRAFVTKPNSVDNSVFGILPMEIYRQTGGTDVKWLELGKGHADAQWIPPDDRPLQSQEKDLIEQGLSWQSRFWIDDMFMVTALESQAFRVTKDKVYLDRAAREMTAYLDRLQQANGLFYHHELSPFYWGRGNGWMAAGMAELLSVLPKDHPQRKGILAGYRKMMAGLLQCQDAGGMWKQLLDKKESWAETSGTGMFTFAMAVGVRNGWLDEATYKQPVRKAWTALAGYLNADGKVREVCEGTNKGTTEAYYETRARNVGDFHGQAAFIWAAWAMAREPSAQP